MLKPDEVANFRTGFYDYLVKLGVIGDGSCFIHCLLLATKEEYDTASAAQRTQMAAEFRQSLADDITQTQFESFSDGNLAKRLYDEEFIHIYEMLHTKLNAGRDSPLKDIINALPIDQISSIMGQHDDIDSTNAALIREIKSEIPGTSQTAVRDLIHKISSKTKTKAYNSFLAKLRDPSEYVDNDLLSVIAAKFDREVYVFDTSGQPYKGLGGSDRPKDLNIFIAYDETDCHYELIGIVDSDGNYSVQFSHDNDLVKKTRKALGYRLGRTSRNSPTPAPLRSPRRQVPDSDGNLGNYIRPVEEIAKPPGRAQRAQRAREAREALEPDIDGMLEDHISEPRERRTRPAYNPNNSGRYPTRGRSLAAARARAFDDDLPVRPRPYSGRYSGRDRVMSEREANRVSLSSLSDRYRQGARVSRRYAERTRIHDDDDDL